MANPILTSDLYKDTGELKKLIGELEDVQNKLEELRKSETVNAAALEKQLRGLNVTTSAQREEVEKTTKQADELAKRYKKYNESLGENAVKIAELKNAQRQLNQVNKLEAKLLTAKQGSYNQLSAQYSLNKIKLNQLSAEERKSTKEGQELVKTTNEIYQEMKRLQEETGKYTLSVGDYKSALNGLGGPLARFSAGLDEAKDKLDLLARNPIVLVLGAIVAALAALGKAFLKSEKGAEVLSKATGVVNALMSKLVDISVQAYEAVIRLFTEPKKAITDFANSIGRGLKALFTDPIGSVNKLKEAVTEVVEEIGEEIDAFVALEQAKKRTIKTNRELIKSIEQLTTAEELNGLIADDTTKSFKEREEAAERARVALEARAAKEIQLARNNLAIINQELDLRRANGEQVEELLDRQLEAYREVISAERELTIAVADNEKTRAELKQDRLERDLDILIDGFDNQKTINERLIADETKTVLERQRLLRQTRILAEDSFAKQIETIQQFTNVQVDANDLLATSDAVLLNQKIRSLGLSEVVEGRILEIIREKRIANQDLAEIERELIEIRKEQLGLPQAPVLGFERSLAEEAANELEEVKKIVQRNTSEAVAEAPATDLYDLLGFNVGDSEKQALSQATAFAINQLKALTQARVDAANAAVEAADREVEAQREELNATIQLANLGFAVNVQEAQRELDLAKETQRKAIEEQKRAQREQQLIDTLQQTSSLITASAKIFATVPFPTSLVAVGTMFGAFALSKIKALQATREFRDGDYTVLSGPKHSGKGTGIPLGIAADGVAEYAEGGEGRAIFTAKAVRKYGSEIERVVNEFNALSYEGRVASSSPAQLNSVVAIDTGEMNDNLAAIRRNSESKFYTSGDGKMIEKYKNRTRIYVN